MMGTPFSTVALNFSMVASSQLRKRRDMTRASAESIASAPERLPAALGLIVPSASAEKSTVVSKPCFSARILAISGIASSERYSSSPASKTTCLPLPAPSPPVNLRKPFPASSFTSAKATPIASPQTTPIPISNFMMGLILPSVRKSLKKLNDFAHWSSTPHFSPRSPWFFFAASHTRSNLQQQ